MTDEIEEESAEDDVVEETLRELLPSVSTEDKLGGKVLLNEDRAEEERENVVELIDEISEDSVLLIDKIEVTVIETDDDEVKLREMVSENDVVDTTLTDEESEPVELIMLRESSEERLVIVLLVSPGVVLVYDDREDEILVLLIPSDVELIVDPIGVSSLSEVVPEIVVPTVPRSVVDEVELVDVTKLCVEDISVSDEVMVMLDESSAEEVVDRRGVPGEIVLEESGSTVLDSVLLGKSESVPLELCTILLEELKLRDSVPVNSDDVEIELAVIETDGVDVYS